MKGASGRKDKLAVQLNKITYIEEGKGIVTR